ncbi:hypothetical protein [Paraburkholderia tropica]|uniref:hypothetical protein n=1 Tax=Paraburkholderia tropica TaxID=92647 RepID=UPI002ABE0250|nr:hypothetical protein [Paraburkholderia tropica]
MNAIMREFIKAAKEAPRLFFLPVAGPIEAIRRKMERIRHDRHPNKPDDVNSLNNSQDRR